MSTERERAGQDGSEHAEFERRVAALLNDSADALDGRTRSALTRARHAALAQAGAPRAASWRAWAPAGALAAGLLVAVFFVGRQGSIDRPGTGTGGPVDDLALVSDADAYDLSTDADMDLDADFYEWAAGAANSGRGLGS
jgi:hypothetical protein